MQAVRVAIIGTAGRKEDASKMSAALFERMVSQAADVMQNRWGLPNERVVLISGGSAWADHVAVRLFLRESMNPDGQPYAGLQLHLPCKLVRSAGGSTSASSSSSSGASVVKFEDTGSWSWSTNPGRMLNNLHSTFSRALGTSTIAELLTAQAFDAKLITGVHGFHARNKQVAASCQRLLAFTWGTSADVPKDGGTKHTWDAAGHARRMHVPLQTLATSSAPRTPAAAVSVPCFVPRTLSQDSSDTVPADTISPTKSSSSGSSGSTRPKRKALFGLDEQPARRPKSEPAPQVAIEAKDSVVKPHQAHCKSSAAAKRKAADFLDEPTARKPNVPKNCAENQPIVCE